MLSTPDLDAQREAMRRLAFLVGTWSGEARAVRPGGAVSPLAWTEAVQFKLGGLLLEIEATGRAQPDGNPVAQALGIVSYDDAAGVYRLRAFNDGRYMESDMTLDEASRELRWGFVVGAVSARSVLRIDRRGDWIEHHEITIGSRPPQTLMDVRVSRENK